MERGSVDHSADVIEAAPQILPVSGTDSTLFAKNQSLRFIRLLQPSPMSGRRAVVGGREGSMDDYTCAQSLKFVLAVSRPLNQIGSLNLAKTVWRVNRLDQCLHEHMAAIGILRFVNHPI